MQKNLLLFGLIAAISGDPQVTAGTKVDIPGPAGSGTFGNTIRVLSNGNLLVIDTGFDLTDPTVSDVGAVYLYDLDGNLISSLHGSTAGDAVGSGGVRELANGNFVVVSPNWDNGGAENAGAVTWGSMYDGFMGGLDVVVSAANSLVGSRSGDNVGSSGVRALANGNYVVNSPLCANGTVLRAGASTWGNGETGMVGVVSLTNSLMGGTFQDSVGSNIIELTNSNYVVFTISWTNPTTSAANAGAVTWANGLVGAVGLVSESNSLVGTTTEDFVSSAGVRALTNGNYVVCSHLWDSPTTVNAGAATWGNGTTGTSGPVSTTNSLYGTTENDLVGFRRAESLTNGNYVISSPFWDNGSVVDVGAATWGNGATGTVGPVTPANSIIGSTAGDAISSRDIKSLQNGNYVVVSPDWDSGAVVNVGAVTFARGNAPTSLVVSPANSLVGSTPEDQVGSLIVEAFTGGDYIVASPAWDNGATVNAGAVTWGSGTSGVKGVVSAGNSLVGSHPNDAIGSQYRVLTNGNYLVVAPNWRGGTGAVTWGNGRSGVRGVVSAANSLVGETAGDAVGSGVLRLSNGNYVVLSPTWDKPNPPVVNAGAVTWGSGTTGIRGLVTAANSLTGTTAEDQLGHDGNVLQNGSFVISSPLWDNPALGTVNVGAATWADGRGPLVGEVSFQNSLVGMTNEDRISQSGITGTPGGLRYVVSSPLFDNGNIVDAGAITLGDGQNGTTGFVTSSNSVLGTVAGQGNTHRFGYDPEFMQLFVGRPASQLVTIFVEGAVVSLGRTRDEAPAVTGSFGAFGALSVNGASGALFEAALSGRVGGNRALYVATDLLGGADLLLQKGQDLSPLGFGLPSNARVTTLTNPITQQGGLGVFQTTFSGSGISGTNHRLVMADTGAGLAALLRTGSPISVLNGAAASRVVEVVESYDSDLVVVSYNLRTGGTAAVTSKTDSGLLLFNHNGTPLANVSAREGSPAFGGEGVFGPIAGRASVLGNVIHFPALYQPPTGRAVQALFSMTTDGATTRRGARVGDEATGVTGAEYAAFPASSQSDGEALFRATLRGVPTSGNEGLWLAGESAPLALKGADVSASISLKYARIQRFWPAGPGRVIVQAKVSGAGVNASNNQVLVLIQENRERLLLMRTGFPAAGTGTARVRAFSAVDVNPVTGAYAVLGTLSGAPAAANQALWVGRSDVGNSGALQAQRLPLLRMRKGQDYSTIITMGTVRSMALRPAVDATGAGGRGLAHAVGANGTIGITILSDFRRSDLVLLP